MNKIKVDRVFIDSDRVLNDLDVNKYDIGKSVSLIVNIKSSKFDDYEFNLSDDAYLEINKYIVNDDVNDTVNINLNGVNARVNYNFSILTNKDEKFTININHNNKNTMSNVINHGVVLNDSKLSFIVNAKVDKGNTNSVLNQSSKIITMGKNNSVIKPNLYIDEFNVEAKHAASIGRFNKEDIFYLLMKGIPKKEAEELLIKGFLEGHLSGR